MSRARPVPGSRGDGVRRQSRDGGNAALELVVLAPVLLALLGLVIAAGRTSVAQGSVDAAARDAARQASLALSPAAAQDAGQASARAALAEDGLDCTSLTVVVDTSQFGYPVGQPASVRARVYCTVPLSDLALPGLPGATTLSAEFSSPLDLYTGSGDHAAVTAMSHPVRDGHDLRGIRGRRRRRRADARAGGL